MKIILRQGPPPGITWIEFYTLIRQHLEPWVNRYCKAVNEGRHDPNAAKAYRIYNFATRRLNYHKGYPKKLTKRNFINAILGPSPN